MILCLSTRSTQLEFAQTIFKIHVYKQQRRLKEKNKRQELSKSDTELCSYIEVPNMWMGLSCKNELETEASKFSTRSFTVCCNGLKCCSLQMGKCHSIQQHELEGRDTLSATMWDKVESTPYGHCMDKCGNYMWKPASEAETANRKSNIYFDHYEVPRGPKIMLAECSKSRAANLATMLASNMDGGSFYDVLQQV